MRRIIHVSVLLLLFLYLISCKRNPYRIDISSVDLNIEILRFEEELFPINPDEIMERIPGLKEKYGSFLQLFSFVIDAGDINDPLFAEYLVEFCTDRQNNEVYNSVTEKFSDISNIEDELGKAFRHYVWYFPGKTIPSVFTCITGFNSSIITGDSVLAIGLDRYLGADSEYYPLLQIYKYVAAKMTPEHIVPDCIYGWGVSEWDYDEMNYASENVINRMIHEGKIRYFMKCMMPELRDEMLFGFTADQMKFCRNNEAQMWQYLMTHDLLFRTDHLTIRKLTGEAPFTSYFTSESPGKAAVWTGFRIIESYMQKNPGTGLEEMMNDVDVQTFLEKARYNPQ